MKQQENPNKLSLAVVQGKSQLSTAANDNHQYKYLFNDHIHVQFFKNPKFGPYLTNYIQQASFPVRIEIQQALSTTEQSLCSYTIEFSGKQEQAKSVCNVIERLFGTVKSRVYHQKKGKVFIQ